jgi:hypothetical protein
LAAYDDGRHAPSITGRNDREGKNFKNFDHQIQTGKAQVLLILARAKYGPGLSLSGLWSIKKKKG